MMDAMSVILLALFPFVFVAGVLIATRAWTTRRGGGAANAEHPTCGFCGYIIRGIEGFICPECGRDLREVGIIPAGARRAMSNTVRLAVWTIAVVPPVLLLGAILSRSIAPTWAVSQQQRVIFVQSPTLFTTVRAQLDGRKLVWGRPSFDATVPFKTLTLTLNTGKPTDHVTVDLATTTGTFTDAAGKIVSGRFDAALIAAWLAANGFARSVDLDPRSTDVLTAVTEMTSGSPRAGGFSYLSPDPSRGQMALVTAHPAFKPNAVAENIPWTNFLPLAMVATVWAIGLPFVLRRRHGVRVESAGDADQA
jgi:hypothetical protein